MWDGIKKIVSRFRFGLKIFMGFLRLVLGCEGASWAEGRGRGERGKVFDNLEIKRGE